jgi:hypothetical protein
MFNTYYVITRTQWRIYGGKGGGDGATAPPEIFV